MKYVKWIVHGLLIIAFAGAGIVKLTTSYEELAADPNMGWVNDFSATQVKIISVLEILGALGLLLPYVVNKFKFFVPLAAIGLAATMMGAAITHLMRGEMQALVPNIVLFVLAILTTIWRKDLFKG